MGLLDKWTKKKKEEQLKEVVDTDKNQTVAPVAKKATEKTEEAKAVVIAPVAPKSLAYKILIRPLVTEKATIAESGNKYSFLVTKEANKTSIIEAIEKVYGVKPRSVRVINVQGKTVRFGKSYGRRSDFKKAIVTLPKGKSLNLHEGV